ncbi:hypothetical protein StrepF001_01200 [Streptomyces sp. F001]|uniref:hypothetical protein n=1 Tax=Streptomyces sp. F001 TaxID=1510026 RepID=UPI00101E5F84|nr:hypothetical protein [Streptomyces sp. F001]RZB19864.1 hypothetical protein StrepF001_01200 [Streptomyces sp. F001]
MPSSSTSRTAHRPQAGPDAAFQYVRPGDCVVIVRLSRFAAGLRNLHDCSTSSTTHASGCAPWKSR